MHYFYLYNRTKYKENNMAINLVNTIEEAQNFIYLKNQSTILRTNETNDICFNGVNVVVNKPKKGDVMCVTRYTDTSGNLLSADEQKIVWIDGLSINPAQLSQDIETVGICVAVNVNKAIVKYKTDDISANRQFSKLSSVNFDENDIEPNCYFNNGFYNNQQTPIREAGCCKARVYERAQASTARPTADMSNIFSIPNRDYLPVRKDDFETNPYCAILRSNFNSYDEYLESMMVKIPCSKGTVGKFPSGKYITYKLASESYPLLKWAADINVNGPNLGAGNWWIPSVAEMAYIMRDITYGVPGAWDSENIDNNTDIVNRVLYKLVNSSNGGNNWHMISAAKSFWTTSLCRKDGKGGTFIYWGDRGTYNWDNVVVGERYQAIAITEVEF